MIQLLDDYWVPIYHELGSMFYEVYYQDVFELLDVIPAKENARHSKLIAAIKAGKVRYVNGVFSGEFNVGISKELAQFATFSARAKIWVGLPPPEVIMAAVQANADAKAINERIRASLPRLENHMTEIVPRLQFSLDGPMQHMDAQAQADVQGLGIVPELTPAIRESLNKNYTDNQQLNIKNWNTEQVTRLRNVIEENAKGGYNINELVGLIQSEWNTTLNKAKFLARQETSIFVSEFRDQRYQDAGLEEYIWSSSDDARCRKANNTGGPSHGPGGPLHGHVFRFDTPPISGPRGERQNPGRPYGCRCVAKPIRRN